MNSIDSKIPRRTECGDHIHDCPQLAEMLDDLREENVRLRQRVEELEQQRVEGVVALCVCENAATPRPGCDCVTCTVKRADQRAEAAEAKLSRLHGLVLRYGSSELQAEARAMLDSEREK